MMVASPLAGRLAGRLPARLLATTGIAVAAAGLTLLAVSLSPSMAYWPVGLALLVVGVGTGTFMTPNTSAIMSTVPATARGVANGLRSMLQNTGFVMSVAMSLAIVTSPLSDSEKRAAYAGTLHRLSAADIGHFVGGFRVAVLVLLALCVVAAVGSALRGRTPGS
jgi:MFS family permease